MARSAPPKPRSNRAHRTNRASEARPASTRPKRARASGLDGHAGGRDRAAERARDEHYMARCIELARLAEGRTAPNPMVGCVIVDPAGQVIAEGFHRRAGAPHAEAMALAKLDGRAPGCTMYVNLEPCNHRTNRRTVPCAPAVAKAGIARLVMGMGDPIRAHAGGAAWLARQGVEVTRGVLRAQCLELNRAFVTRARHGRPHFTLKAGITLDGKVATRTGASQWITGSEARRDGHRLRNALDAIMVGSGTVLADDPRLTARGLRGARDPVRVVVDGRLRTPPTAQLLPANSTSKARVIIATTERAARTREARLCTAGAEVWRLGPGPKVDLAGLAKALAQAEFNSVLVEGGADLAAALLSGDLIDEIRLYLAPMILGGRGPLAGLGWVGGDGVDALAEARKFRFAGAPTALGDDLALTLRRPKRSR